MLPPTAVLLQIGYAAAVSAAVLLATWPWRERGWPVPLALGLGVATTLGAARGIPDLWPVDTTELLFHFALLGAVLGAAEAAFPLPAPVRWAGRAVVAAACSWALFRTVDPAWKIGLVAGAGFVLWSALAWRAERAPGYGLPAALVVVAGAGAMALERGHSAVLAQGSGALAAAAAPAVLYAFARPSLGRGVVTAFTLAALPLWASGARFATMPLESAALLSAAPLAAQRRGWVGALLAALAAGFAVWLSHAANLPDPSDPYGY